MDFEKLGAFYLGRPFDLEKRQPKDGLILYDSKDLVTHAVCVGMTGSGKTGLCIALLEEAAIDGIPAIIIDPKGDLANLLLTFPDLSAQDFQPWINLEDAEKKGMTAEQYAAQQAAMWREGLGEWGQDGDRIRRLREAAEFRIYTPGSNAGFPVSILNSFTAPAASLAEDNELLNERVNTLVTGLLGLVGIEGDPIRSREHILLSNIVRQAWSAGTSLDLAGLIQRIQQPPISKVGVMDLDSFFPPKERFDLAMLLNNLLAAPSFSSWLEGEPLDLQSILHNPKGKPRLAIFSIAHLSDAERMFFVTLLLNETLGWMRAQPGTASLRAILYMDEILGYFPPVANPPAKLPLLTLLKQGRAFGLGVVLVTQNPVDLDYKGLGNTGTWFIGRLQTERDKARVIEGLEGVATTAGQGFDRQKMEQILASLGNRIFLLNNVHEDASEIFESRWAMSYLRGPLTRTQIKSLMEPEKGKLDPIRAQVDLATTASSSTSTPRDVSAQNAQASPPVLPPEVTQFFVPSRSAGLSGRLLYVPMIFGVAEVSFSNKSLETTEELTFATPLWERTLAVDWNQATALDIPISDLEQSPEAGAAFASLPAAANKPKNLETWKKDFANWLYRNQRLNLWRSPSLEINSKIRESERDFRIRLQQVAREKRDEAVEGLRQKYAPKIATLEERRRRAEQARDREAEQSQSQKMQTAISFGATLLSSFMGRKAFGLSTLGRATTAARGVGRTMKEAQDVGRAEENIQAIEQQLAELNRQFQDETASLEQTFAPQTESLETITLKPRKTDIMVKLVSLVWVPHNEDAGGQKTPLW